MQRINQAGMRLDAITPLLDLEGIPWSQRYPHLFPDGASVKCRTEAIAWCALQIGRNPLTIRRWLNRHRAGGINGLNDKVRCDRGTSRSFTHSPEAAAFAVYLHRNWKLNPTQIRAALLHHAPMFNFDPCKVPSDETIRLFLKGTPVPALITLSLQGQTNHRSEAFEFIKQLLPQDRRKRRPQRRNSK